MKIKCKDGSVFEEKNKEWVKAVEMRLKENKDWLNELVNAVDMHWKKKTIPNKFGGEDPWEKEYKNQAETLEEVAYPYLRVILMGMMMNKLSKGKSKVIALNDDGTQTEYPSGKKVKL